MSERCKDSQLTALALLLILATSSDAGAQTGAPQMLKPGFVSMHSLVVDSFDSVTQWSTNPAEGVEITVHPDSGRHGRGMRVDFDFHGHTGYGMVRRNVDLDVPPNYEFSFSVRGEAPTNTLEFKLVDRTGTNVWWSNNKNFAFSREWQTIARKKREICFAWGPLDGGEIHHVSAIEFAITAGSGGKGSVWIDDLALAPLDLDSPFDRIAPVASTPIVGTWENAEPFSGVMGVKLDFLADGSYNLMEGAMLEFDYKVSNDQLMATHRDPTTGKSDSFTTPIHIEQDTLVQRGDNFFGKDVSMKRIRPARDGDDPIVGVWSYRDSAGLTAFVSFAKDGRGMFRVPMGFSPGTWTESGKGHLTSTTYNLRIVPHMLTCTVGQDSARWDYSIDHGVLAFRNSEGTSGTLIRRAPPE
jgi:hypothetical protein